MNAVCFQKAVEKLVRFGDEGFSVGAECRGKIFDGDKGRHGATRFDSNQMLPAEGDVAGEGGACKPKRLPACADDAAKRFPQEFRVFFIERRHGGAFSNVRYSLRLFELRLCGLVAVRQLSAHCSRLLN